MTFKENLWPYWRCNFFKFLECRFFVLYDSLVYFISSSIQSSGITLDKNVLLFIEYMQHKQKRSIKLHAFSLFPSFAIQIQCRTLSRRKICTAKNQTSIYLQNIRTKNKLVFRPFILFALTSFDFLYLYTRSSISIMMHA